MSGPHHGLLASKLGKKTSENLGAIQTDLDDARALAASLCPRLTLEDDLLAEIVNRSDGRARRIVVNLIRAGELARNLGLTRLDRAAWGSNGFFDSRPPSPRNIAALARGV